MTITDTTHYNAHAICSASEM